VQRYLLRCVFAGSSLEVKIETNNNDAMEVKTEADCNDVTDYTPSTGIYVFNDGIVRSLIGLHDLYGVYNVLCFISLAIVYLFL